MKFKALLFFTFVIQFAKAQIIPSYNQHFDSAACSGWTHYALMGADQWERGIPNDMYLNDASSAPNVWATDLDGPVGLYAVMVLETPSFDLSDMSRQFLLNFSYQISATGSQGGNIDYSTDGGVNWNILNGTAAEKTNWYNNASCIGLYSEPTWSYSSTSTFVISTHNLAFLQGEPNVKFRFKYGSSAAGGDGWAIDNFSIIENAPNIRGAQGVTFKASKHFLNFDVVTPLLYTGTSLPVVNNTTNYYFSKDAIFDAADSLLGTKSQAIIGSIGNWSKTFGMVPNLYYGDYYIFCQHDAANNLLENSETDNVGYCILHIDSTFLIPEYEEDFEDSVDFWSTNAFYSSSGAARSSNLTKGDNNIPRLEHTHSGTKSWYMQNIPATSSYIFEECLESPYLDLRPAPNNVVCFWHRGRYQYFYGASASFFDMSNTAATPIFPPGQNIPPPRVNDWDCHCFSIAALNTAKNAKIRFRTKSPTSSSHGLINLDDIYIGQPKPDVSIEHKKTIYTPQNLVIDTLRYVFYNSGLAYANASNSKFYWSADSILDGSDVLIADVSELGQNDTSFNIRKVAYTKPTTAAGNYYIVYSLDAGNALAEMRENNNSGFYKVVQDTLLPLPYSNDFESQTIGWSHNASILSDDWICTTPTGVLSPAFSGTKAWITKSDGIISPGSRMHLYTPSFDFSTISYPVLEFDMRSHLYNRMNLSYSIDEGASWIVLDTSQSFCRWYYTMRFEDWAGRDFYQGPAGSGFFYKAQEWCFTSIYEYNTREVSRNTRYILDLRFLTGIKNVKFRYNIASDVTPSVYPYGAMIDNFTIRDAFIDLEVVGKKSLMMSSLSQNIKFFMNIKNRGDYVSAPSVVKFYVSADTILDGSDFYLGQEVIPAIRPDMSFYINEIYSGPALLSGYAHLLYELDATATNAESNESNNIGNWPLALDNVTAFPYEMDFNDTIVNGWNHYVFYASGVHASDIWRFRNQTAPGEPLTLTQLQSGQMFTEKINNVLTMSSVPFMFLETPAFNFTGYDSIDMKFEMMCIGRDWDGASANGANMQYTIDGGSTWLLLDQTYTGQAYNWYNHPNLSDLNNDTGWAMLKKPVSLLDSVYFNLSFLRNQPNVVFRFQFRSDERPMGSDYPFGFRLDNFKMNSYKIDYIANDSMSPVILNPGLLTLNVNYSIVNAGQEDGRPTTTKFYWSADSLFDSSDSLVKTISESNILLGNTLNAIASITYPLPLTQTTYYLFYFVDADADLTETNENNNKGSFKISVPMFINYEGLDAFDTINALIAVPTIAVNYSILNSGLQNGISSETKFYWSADNVHDLSDANIQTITEGGISSLDTLNALIGITYPTPITQTSYYLFYSADANSAITESFETDNEGAYIVVFDYNNSINENSNEGLNVYVNERLIYIQSTLLNSDENYTLSILNSVGQTLSASQVRLEKGLNKFKMPEKIASGIYLVVLQNEHSKLFYKTVISN
ncbi:MAG TPA: CARDB domain-containing protein [Bacteroidia bacterium]|jgi:hypothetical protein